jgi:hypothetical protein
MHGCPSAWWRGGTIFQKERNYCMGFRFYKFFFSVFKCNIKNTHTPGNPWHM